jgi:hypothetical protein
MILVTNNVELQLHDQLRAGLAGSCAGRKQWDYTRGSRPAVNRLETDAVLGLHTGSVKVPLRVFPHLKAGIPQETEGHSNAEEITIGAGL